MGAKRGEGKEGVRGEEEWKCSNVAKTHADSQVSKHTRVVMVPVIRGRQCAPCMTTAGSY